MPTAEQIPVLVQELINRFETQWDSTNIDDISFNFTKGKNIHPGWFNGDNPRPQITVNPVDENEQARFMTKNGPGQDRLAICDCNVWIRRNMEDNSGNSLELSSPDITGRQIAQQMKKIILDDVGFVDGFLWVMPGRTQKFPVDTDRKPPVYRWVQEVDEYHLVEP